MMPREKQFDFDFDVETKLESREKLFSNVCCDDRAALTSEMY